MAKDVNIKINVDASQAEGSSKSLRSQIKDLREEMAAMEVATNGLSDATSEQRQRYQQLQEQAGALTDAMGDVQQRIRANADDFQKFSAILEGVGAATAGVQALTGQLELLGVTNVGAEKLTKTFIALQGQLNAINTIQRAMNKDSKMMIQLQTAMNAAMVKGGSAAKAAAVAQRALNAAMKAAPYIAIASALLAVVSAIANFIKDSREAAKEQEALSKSVDSATASLRAQHREIGVNADASMAAAKSLYNLAKGAKSVGEQSAYLRQFSQVTGMNVKSVSALDDAWTSYSTTVNKNLKLADQNKKSIENNNKAILEQKTAIAELQSEREAIIAKGHVANEKYFNAEIARHEQTIALAEKSNEAIYVAMQTQLAKADVAVTSFNDKYADKTKNITKIVKDEAKKRTAAEQEELDKQFRAFAESENAKRQLFNERNVEFKEANTSYYQQQWQWYQDDIAEANAADEQIAEFYKEKQREKQDVTLSTMAAVAEIQSNLTGIITTLQDIELSNAEGNERKQKAIKKKYAISNAMMNIAQIGVQTALGAMSAYQAMASIPMVGPALGAVAAAAVSAVGAVQIASAISEAAKIRKAAKGDYVVGPSHSEGGVRYELEGGEAVINKRAMAIPEFRQIASDMNVATGGVSFPGASSARGRSALSATIDAGTIEAIVAKTVAGMSSIPVVVSERSITNAQSKRVSIINTARL